MQEVYVKARCVRVWYVEELRVKALRGKELRGKELCVEAWCE